MDFYEEIETNEDIIGGTNDDATMKKVMTIKKHENAKAERGGMGLKNLDYCVGADLRNWPDTVTRLVEAGLDLK
ncbi:hypothetical protein INT48_001381 [Thamnidium elegans]|uniref:Uncharacterized protein n=1 Tax=Thamnidium elegans TaxID=101142 RepID=A0A8H7VYQ5_9FUNG|nr:hypothetical protein INT48_001381 [Thamnidium elegans]